MPFKVCEKCGEKNGVRSKSCKKCEAKFAISLKSLTEPKLQKLDNWLELRRDDIIKVTGGPYFLSNQTVEIEDENGDKRVERVRSSMGHNGIFKVFSLTNEGIIAFGRKVAGQFFILMVNKGYDKETGIYREAHRVKRVKMKERV